MKPVEKLLQAAFRLSRKERRLMIEALEQSLVKFTIGAQTRKKILRGIKAARTGSENLISWSKAKKEILGSGRGKPKARNPSRRG